MIRIDKPLERFIMWIHVLPRLQTMKSNNPTTFSNHAIIPTHVKLYILRGRLLHVPDTRRNSISKMYKNDYLMLNVKHE